MNMSYGTDLRTGGGGAPQTGPGADMLMDETLPSIRGLIAALDRMGVRYCHWKSNVRLAESLVGDEDLDLLVHRQDAEAFRSALSENGFKLAVSRVGMGHPGVFHAFALDPDQGKLAHVHAYFQIVSGDSLVKSYCLPFENALLSGGRRLHGVPVPAPEAELVMFALRVALKHTSPVEAFMVGRGYGSVARELEWLNGPADGKAAETLWESWVPGADRQLFRDLLDAIRDEGAVLRRVRLGLRVARYMRGYRRLGFGAVAISQLRRTMRLAMRRVYRRRELALETGGMVIALVGPKASGKSTLSNAVTKRLGQHFDVLQVHVGKPPATALSLLPTRLVPLVRRLFPSERSGEYDAEERRQGGHSSLLHVLRMTLLAYDRRALLRRIWRASTNGTIVLADRYPSSTIGATDSSRFDDKAIAQCDSPVKRWLMRRERALYEGLPRPGLVIRLAAPIETTIRRDAERVKDDGPNRTALERRWERETAADFSGCNLVRVSTDRTLDETVNTALLAIWSNI